MIVRRFAQLLALCCSAAAFAADFSSEDLEFFEKQVRPILVDRCFSCHSHSSEKLKGGLYLDSREGALKGGDTGPAIVPGSPQQSLMIEAIQYMRTDLQMPPKARLSDTEIGALIDWIKRSAPWPTGNAATTPGKKSESFDLEKRRTAHWSWRPIANPPIPPAESTGATSHHPVDRFLAPLLAQKGLRPNPTADRRTLIRRVHLDLVGFPPTAAETETFVNDADPQAWGKLVDRLLESPHFGERWARHWFDLVRYAETMGHEFDYPRHNAWQYRDYVIRALNADVPYDQFVREHIAGDLLPNPRRNPTTGINESVIGTGFWWFGQQVHSPVDLRVNQADLFDNQIDVFSKTFLGLTVSCARCHDHKFDAISTRDFYALYGVVGSSRYSQAAINGPQLDPTAAQSLASARAALRVSLSALLAEEVRHTRAYLLAATPLAAHPNRPKNYDDLAKSVALDPDRLKRWVDVLADKASLQPQHPLYAWRIATRNSSTNPVPTEAPLPDDAARWLSNANDSQSAPNPPPDRSKDIVLGRFSPGASHAWRAEGDGFSGAESPAGDWVAGSAARPLHALLPEAGLSSGNRTLRLHGALRSPSFIIPHRYLHVRVAGREARINVVIHNFTLIRDPIYGGLKRNIHNESPHWITFDLNQWLDQRAYVEILDHPVPDPAGDPQGSGLTGFAAAYEAVLSPIAAPPGTPQNHTLALLRVPENDAPTGINSLGALADRYQAIIRDAATAWSSLKLTATNPPPTAPLDSRLHLLSHLVQAELLGRVQSLEAARIPELPAAVLAWTEADARTLQPTYTPAMTDSPGHDETVFIRGNPRTPGDRVQRRFLEAFEGSVQRPFQNGSGRLELAEQLVARNNPFPARVMANRIWLHLFGRGLIPTPDDLGVLGQPPTHPELLDWLASYFRDEAHWSVKRVLRLLATSRAYQMSSNLADRDTEEKDPDNTYYHRMNVRRLEGEVIRDSILTLSGRLDKTPFGPPIPVHLTEFMDGRGRPSRSGPIDGDGRRSVYIEVRNNFLPPMMRTFDTPIPFTTVGRRTVSNVPAQSLILLNDPFVLGQAKLWAKRLLSDPLNASAEDRIRSAYRSAFGRNPTKQELARSQTFLSSQSQLLPSPEKGAAAEEQVWTDFCHVLLNTKEFIYNQ